MDQNTRKHQDWFDNNDEDIQKLLDEKREAFISLQQDNTSASKKAPYNSIKGEEQTKFREMQDSWLNRTSPLLSADGSTLLSDKNAILKRWAEHCNNVLNRPSSINVKAIDSMLQAAINTSMVEPPKEPEVKEAIKLSSIGKAPGSDSIPAEICRAGQPVLLQELTKLFQTM
ncbi:hypothetical protein NDU88_003312 [Pleurodeles waltl]|uniref:Uncharacterized protein n=1 Tax=Pleurodeles waltl TaxID=8319 RepID=A0AAV7RGG2_PLEWA|nr:hypothetical protein NDU88_003312 [Pleurodeles waltl]